MAQGHVPNDVLVDVPAGLWKAPRWAGIEIAPASVIICLELFAAIFHSIPFTCIAIVGGGFWWYILGQLFLRDERFLRIFLKTLPFHHLAYLRGNALASTYYEQLKKVLR